MGIIFRWYLHKCDVSWSNCKTIWMHFLFVCLFKLTAGWVIWIWKSNAIRDDWCVITFKFIIKAKRWLVTNQLYDVVIYASHQFQTEFSQPFLPNEWLISDKAFECWFYWWQWNLMICLVNKIFIQTVQFVYLKESIYCWFWNRNCSFGIKFIDNVSKQS